MDKIILYGRTVICPWKFDKPNPVYRIGAADATLVAQAICFLGATNSLAPPLCCSGVRARAGIVERNATVPLQTHGSAAYLALPLRTIVAVASKMSASPMAACSASVDVQDLLVIHACPHSVVALRIAKSL
jgi:hypothetical protein